MSKKDRDVAYFLSFCIEQYKNANGLTGEQAMRRLDEFGVLEYLRDNFEVLHTQGHRWLLEEIDSFMDERRKG